MQIMSLSSVQAVVTNLVARDIAAGVELARSMGYQMPHDFDIGVRFFQERTCTRIRLRLDDATYDSLVKMRDVAEPVDMSLLHKQLYWTEVWERLHADALTLANVWIDKHPEAAPKNNETCVRLVDRLKCDEGAFARWMSECHERAAGFVYTKR